MDYQFEGDTTSLQNISDAGNVIEFVTSPNNPDGKLTKAVLQGPNSSAIYDRVYYWPHFTAIPTAANDDLMIFSLSKLTGHAGTRFGYVPKFIYHKIRVVLSMHPCQFKIVLAEAKNIENLDMQIQLGKQKP